jgi:hypothetical protein
VLTPQHNHPDTHRRTAMRAKGSTSNSGGLLALWRIVALSAFDRLSIAPLLIPIAGDLHTTDPRPR